ncbi:hypothetical protein DZE40_001963 [Clostridium beijerinckii]|uniref:Uncharacterized protein n=1 Tax=Clostridium beijerinckii TaxID=1520 RepID=A0A1S8SA34_CLOBE|nr:hypothetical protein [Clostridium beijerinckii]OOM62311.1 hypothetical protein CLBCK_18490 [Clostridium beijerinckii]
MDEKDLNRDLNCINDSKSDCYNVDTDEYEPILNIDDIEL